MYNNITNLKITKYIDVNKKIRKYIYVRGRWENRGR